MKKLSGPGVLPKRGTPGFVSRPSRPDTGSEHIITFTPDGTVRCLWTEAVPLHKLGRLEVHRASTIEFNNATQHWEVKDQKRKLRFFSESRSACLDWEQQNLQPQ